MIKSRDTSTPNHPERELLVDNGDLEGLNRIMDKYSFVDHQAAIRFAMVVLLEADDSKKVYVMKDGVITALQPSDNLISNTQSEDNTDKPDGTE